MFSLPNLNLNTFHNHKTTKWNVYFYNFFSKIIYSLHTLYNRPLCFYFTYLTNVYTYFTTFGRHFFFLLPVMNTSGRNNTTTKNQPKLLFFIHLHNFHLFNFNIYVQIVSSIYTSNSLYTRIHKYHL